MAEVIHFYDDQTGKLYLASGHEVHLDPKQFSCMDQAVDMIADWAKGIGLIEACDQVAGVA